MYVCVYIYMYVCMYTRERERHDKHFMVHLEPISSDLQSLSFLFLSFPFLAFPTVNITTFSWRDLIIFKKKEKTIFNATANYFLSDINYKTT